MCRDGGKICIPGRGNYKTKSKDFKSAWYAPEI